MIEPTAQAINTRQNALAPSGVRFAAGYKAPNWSLNQILDAQVIRLAPGAIALKINGQIFTPVGSHQFLPGTHRQLRVDSLDPTVRLTVIDKHGGAETPVKLTPAAVSADVRSTAWASSIASSQTKLATLLSVFHRVPESLARQLSAQTLSSIYTLSGWIPNLAEFREPGRLRAVLRDLNQLALLNPNNTAANAGNSLGKLMAAVRNNLATQLRGLHSSDAQLVLARSYSGDKSLQKASLNTAMALIDDAVHYHNIGQRRVENSWMPWVYTLPYRLRGKCYTLQIHINARKRRRKNPTKIEFWNLKCQGEFPLFGLLKIQLGVSDSKCGINLYSPDDTALQNLGIEQAHLETLLSEAKLHLVRFRCNASGTLEDPVLLAEPMECGESKSGDWASVWELPETVSESLNSIHAKQAIPALSGFEISDSSPRTEELKEIPEKVYQALACLFVFLLETAEKLGEE